MTRMEARLEPVRGSPLRVAWRRQAPAHPRRYLLWLLLLGVVHASLLLFGDVAVRRSEWGGLVEGGWPLFLPLLVLAAWGTGWGLRSLIAGSRGLVVPALALLGTLLGSYLFHGLLFLLGGLQVLVTDGFESSALLSLGFFWLFAVPLAIYSSWTLLPLAFPLTWLTLLALRRAAGGRVVLSPGRSSAAQRGGG